MITKVISGGQTGVDQAALRAARACGISTGGWMPRGFLAETGKDYALALRYHLREHESPYYPPRTEANVRDSDLTLWLAQGPSADSPGFHCTQNAAIRLGKPCAIIDMDRAPIDHPAQILAQYQVQVLNVAGGRESRSPGIGVRAEAYLIALFSLLQAEDVGQ